MKYDHVTTECDVSRWNLHG